MNDTKNTIESSDNLREDILDLFRELPEGFQDALVEIKLDEKIEKIGENQLLSENQINTLELETLMFLMGVNMWEEFVENIYTKLDLNEDQLESLTNDLDTFIFTPFQKMISGNGGQTSSESWRAPREAKVVGVENNTNIATPIPQQSVGNDPYRESFNDEDEKDLNKDDLLKEIEKDDSPQTPLNKDFLSGNIEKTSLEKKNEMLNDMSLVNENKEKVSEVTPNTPTIPKPTGDLIEDKLSKPVSAGSESREVVEKDSEIPSKNYKGAVDPYRESIQ